MVESLTAVSPRKVRLFAFACLTKLNEQYPTDSALAAVAAIEDYAEDRISEKTLRDARDEFWELGIVPGFGPGEPDPRDEAIWEGMGPDAKFAALITSLLVSDILETSRTAFDEQYTINYPPGHGPVVSRRIGRHYYSLPLGPVSSELSGSLRDIVGNPFRPIVFNPAWRTSTVRGLASAIYAERAFDRLPILADALEDAGCDQPDLLAHCRSDGPHVRGCWAVDLILAKS